MGKVFWGVWDCTKCGRKDISAKEDKCPSCGSVKDKDTIYREGTEEQQIVIEGQEKENVLSGEDWKCSYCDRLNHNWHDRCECGASKDESDVKYFELKAIEEREQNEINKRELEDEIKRHQNDLDNNPTKTVEEEIYTRGQSDDKSYSRERGNISEREKNLSSNIKKSLHQNWSRILVALFCILAVVGIGSLIVPKSVEINVNKVMWESNINVDILKTFSESDWNVPTGGRITSTSKEIRSYKDVPDGTEMVTKYKSETVQDGYTTRNLGNGAFEKVPKYRTEQVPYTVTQTKYRKEPVYDTKYYYDIDKYVHNRTVATNGEDKDPYYGELSLKDKERESNRATSYTVTGTYKDKEKTYKISKEDWLRIEKGDIIKGKASMGNFELEKEKD